MAHSAQLFDPCEGRSDGPFRTQPHERIDMNLTPKVFDVAVVGAGPAGAAAAITAVNYGLSVCVLDEQARFGGQIFRQPPRSFQVDGWMTDQIYASGRQLIQ